MLKNAVLFSESGPAPLLINDTNKRYAIGASGAAEVEATGAVSVTLAASFFDLQEMHAKLINEAKKNNCFIILHYFGFYPPKLL
jgi:hypothetical protein